MRDPAHAAAIVGAMTRAVKIPVTVKMRAGWTEDEINAPLVARLVADAGASAVTVHGRTAKQAYTGSSDWALIDRVARERRHSGDRQRRSASSPSRSSSACGPTRVAGVHRRPRRAAQPLASGAGRRICSKAGRCATVSSAERGRVPPRLHRSAAARARRRGASASATPRRWRPRKRRARARGARAGPRALGDQQAARADVLVQQGARRRLAPAHPRQPGQLDRRAARHRPRVLRGRPDHAAARATASVG